MIWSGEGWKGVLNLDTTCLEIFPTLHFGVPEMFRNGGGLGAGSRKASAGGRVQVTRSTQWLPLAMMSALLPVLEAVCL